MSTMKLYSKAGETATQTVPNAKTFVEAWGMPLAFVGFFTLAAVIYRKRRQANREIQSYGSLIPEDQDVEEAVE